MEEYESLLRLKENESIELKECGEKIPLSFYESYCAMANGSGGYIYLGIIENEPLNIINGITNTPQKKIQLCNALTNKSKISNNEFSSSDISIIETSSGEVIKIRVKPVSIENRPVFLNGDPSCSFKRVHEGDKLLEQEEIQAMLNDASRIKFDQKPNEFGFTIDDLDKQALEDFIKIVKFIRKIPLIETMDEEGILSRLGALVVDKESGKHILTNGAVLFFGKGYAINSICPSLWLDYQEKEKGAERFTNRINNKDLSIEPNIYNFFNRVYTRLSSVIPAPFYLENGINLGQKYVIEIVREALANAISNLELFSIKGLVAIKSSNTLYIKNAGGILTGLEQALKGGVSIPRNPCIFNFFLALGISDHGGYGIPSIFDVMNMLNLYEPELKESWNRDETSLYLNFSPTSKALNKNEQKALAYIAKHPEGISSSSLAAYLGCSKETARQIIYRLIELGEVNDNSLKKKGRLYFAS